MRQEFIQLVQKLQTDALAAVSVSNKKNYQELLKSTYGHELIQNYGSVQNYFEKLNQEGHTNLIIQEWRKNGNTKIKKGNPFEVSFEKPQPTQPTIQTMGNIFQSLNGTGTGLGLGFADIMTLNTNSELKARYEVENEFLKKENKKLEDEVFSLKEKILQSKFDNNNKSATSETINNALAQLPGVLQAIFPVKETATALNAPVQNLSEIKSQLQQLLQHTQFSDPMAELLLLVNNKINQEEGFYKKLMKLLETQT